MKKMTFADLVKREPRLAELEAEIKLHARRNRRTRNYCANHHWYGYDDVAPPGKRGFRGKVYMLAGWGAALPELRSVEAYDMAYDYLYALLPDCRHDGPFC